MVDNGGERREGEREGRGREALWSKIEKNTDKKAIQSFTVPRARQ